MSKTNFDVFLEERVRDPGFAGWFERGGEAPSGQILRRGAASPNDLVWGPTCFRAGTRVWTERGWRAIEAVLAGYRVWTHAGRLVRVINVQSRPHVGALLGLLLEGREAVVWCTPEHRFLVSSAGLTPLAPSPSDGEGVGGEVTPGTLTSNSEVYRTLGGLNPALIKLARELRYKATEAEDQLWQCLRARRLNGLKFRRQHPLGPHYIPDFYCPQTKVSVELDGEVHNSRRAQWADGIRHRQIQEAGVRVVRFNNRRVKEDLESVLGEIAALCEAQLELFGNGGEARPGWRQARELRASDFIVADKTGGLARLSSIERILTDESVYDLTVEGNHSFITEAGVAHNCGSRTTIVRPP